MLLKTGPGTSGLPEGASRGSGHVPGPPKEPKIMAQYSKIESIGSVGSIILAILEVQVITGCM